MKEKIVIDLGRIMDEIFEAAQDVGDAFKNGFNAQCCDERPFFQWDEKVDYYPSYNYPPANIYLTEARELVFEFALAGFEEQNLSLSFRGDYMIFTAKPSEERSGTDEGVRYFKRRLKFKPIDEQKYYVPESKFDRDKSKAVFKSGILTITVPPKANAEQEEDVKVDITKEGD